MKKNYALLLVWVLIFLTACIPEDHGILQGKVNIGPLTPVVQEGVIEPTPDASVFATRQIVIFSQDGKKEIAKVPIQPDGSYSIELPIGKYFIDINHSGIDFSKDLPVIVEIKKDQIFSLDIDIDTGIR
jgi:hypothetical protein